MVKIILEIDPLDSLNHYSLSMEVISRNTKEEIVKYFILEKHLKNILLFQEAYIMLIILMIL
jgi:hypothetical protein